MKSFTVKFLSLSLCLSYLLPFVSDDKATGRGWMNHRLCCGVVHPVTASSAVFFFEHMNFRDDATCVKKKWFKAYLNKSLSEKECHFWWFYWQHDCFVLPSESNYIMFVKVLLTYIPGLSDLLRVFGAKTCSFHLLLHPTLCSHAERQTILITVLI